MPPATTAGPATSAAAGPRPSDGTLATGAGGRVSPIWGVGGRPPDAGRPPPPPPPPVPPRPAAVGDRRGGGRPSRGGSGRSGRWSVDPSSGGRAVPVGRRSALTAPTGDEVADAPAGRPGPRPPREPRRLRLGPPSEAVGEVVPASAPVDVAGTGRGPGSAGWSGRGSDMGTFPSARARRPACVAPVAGGRAEGPPRAGALDRNRATSRLGGRHDGREAGGLGGRRSQPGRARDRLGRRRRSRRQTDLGQQELDSWPQGGHEIGRKFTAPPPASRQVKRRICTLSTRPRPAKVATMADPP